MAKNMGMEKLKQWLDEERGRGLALAKYLNVPQPFVSNMATGIKAVPVSHGAAIEAFTGGAVSRREMFPDEWPRIWPELIAAAPDAPAADEPQQPSAAQAQPAELGVA